MVRWPDDEPRTTDNGSRTKPGFNVSKKKHKHPFHKQSSPADTRARVDRAVREGRFQQALELSKQLYKDNPSAEHRALLHTVYMGRARQLRLQGATRDALTVLFAAQQPPGLTPEWKNEIAAELAACGDVEGALRVSAGATGDGPDPVILARAVDGALSHETAGRNLLPENLRGDFDRVLTAFAQLEAGQDEEFRETIQGIGLKSPFLEWKLMLRGLQAYYQNDNLRALENWQRLTPERLPARLIAPLRTTIDRDFRAAQPPPVQTALERMAGRLQSSAALQTLRDLQASLVRGGTGSLGTVFRQAEQALQAVRREAPQLVPRLESCMYWALLTHGEPEDVPRYLRVFGSPAHDPGLHRLQAMGWERAGSMDEAHRQWQLFEKEVHAHPEAWNGQGERVRALVWQHMGKNAASMPDLEKLGEVPPFLQDELRRLRPLKPTAEECFRRSLALVPDLVETHVELFRYFQHKGDVDRAIHAAHDLLAHSPGHVETLTGLGDLLLRKQDYPGALDAYRRALKNNPLDRKLRGKVGTAHLYLARSHAEAGQFEEARQEYRSCLSLKDGDSSSVLCKWAACEFKAGDKDRGEELLQQALAQTGNELAVNYSMLIEVSRLKLHGSYKTRFNKGFNEGLAAPPSGKAAAGLATMTASHHAANVTYYGQKTHQKKVLDYLKKATKADFTEAELEETCEALFTLESYRLTATYAELGQRRFPKDPLFFLIHARNEMARGPGTFSLWSVRQMLDTAEKLAQALPPERRREELLEEIHDRQQAIEALNPFGRMFGSIFESFDPFGFYDDEDDDDEFDY
jgi:tetratricopeptide (TPR) repeat protein